MGAYAKIRDFSGETEIVPLVGSATMTSNSFSATFSGGGFAGSASGGTPTRPGDGTNCPLIGIDNATVTFCGDSRSRDFCVYGSFLGGLLTAVTGGFTCSGREVQEIRLPFGSFSGFCD